MSPAQSQPALYLSKVERRYPQGDSFLEVLRGTDLAIWPGEIVALVAPSGTGKSTLLHVAGLLEKPDGGEVFVGSKPTASMTDQERTRVRREELGFVYQFHHLLPEFSALENVVIPQLIRGLSKAEAQDRATQLLAFLGLGKRLVHRPGELSGGEQQRVAIARALMGDHAMLLCDEPTGNLDSANTESVLALFDELAVEGLTLVMVTHEDQVAQHAKRRVRMIDGQLTEETR
jgi:lipoprotein-releasing system ATP-binding protein